MQFSRIILSLFLLTFSMQMIAQTPETSELYLTLKKKDSLLFEVGFNTCDVSQFEKLIATDFEFYHDQSGMIKSKEEFMQGITIGLCSETNQTKSRRELVAGSLIVFPLYKNGVLYGAIQKGEHKFFQSTNGETETKGSIAKFSHVWIKEGNVWKLKRVLSYNHKMQ